MKKNTLFLVISMLAISVVLHSCKKDDPDPEPADNTPVLNFITGNDYVSSDITLEESTTFKVGVIGSKNSNTTVDIATFKVVRTNNGQSTTVFENNTVNDSYLSWESDQITMDAVGNETWAFSITDYSGKIKEISFVITTTGDLSPLISFVQDTNFVFSDIVLEVSSPFQVGINAAQSQYSSSTLNSLTVSRSFENSNMIIVYDTTNINAASFSWETAAFSNDNPGQETWTFSLEDMAGETSELSFIITTSQSPYIPYFSPTYLVNNVGGIDLLDFYLTCITDDWEMIKIIVTYPGGLGTDTYIGNGIIMNAGSPFTFSNYFPYLSGIWTFSITGIIKSGEHDGESFTVMTTMAVN